MREKNPKIKIGKGKTDYFIETLTFLLLIIFTIQLIYNLNLLPDTVPVHFNSKGLPDRYSTKYELLILPLFTIIISVSLFYLNKFPHLFNYTVKVTEENAKLLYKYSTRFIRILNLYILLGFHFLWKMNIDVAKGNATKINSLFIILFFTIGTIFFLIFYIISIDRANKKITANKKK